MCLGALRAVPAAWGQQRPRVLHLLLPPSISWVLLLIMSPSVRADVQRGMGFSQVTIYTSTHSQHWAGKQRATLLALLRVSDAVGTAGTSKLLSSFQATRTGRNGWQ